MTDSAQVEAFVSVAGNLEPERHLFAAMEALEQHVAITGVSTFYRTPAIGRPEQPDYRNGCITVRTGYSPLALKHDVLRPIEAQLGRQRSGDRYAARPIDLDILIYHDHVIVEAELTLPDPDILTRPFLSAAILELAPHMKLPGDEKMLRQRVDTRVLADLTVDKALTQRLKERFIP